MAPFEISDSELSKLTSSPRAALMFKLLKFIAIANFAFWIAGIIPFFLRPMGVKYLPAPENFIFLPAWSHWVIGFSLTLPFVLFFLLLAKHSFSEGDVKGFLMLLAMGLFAPFMTGFSVNMTFGATLPMVHTAIFGNEGQIEYVVTNKYSSSASAREGCVRGIDVETNVFGYSSLCGFDWDARKNLSEGSVITVSGKASRAGVYYESFRRGRIKPN